MKKEVRKNNYKPETNMAVKKEIDWAKVEMYLQAGCKQVDIAQSFCISRDTLRDRAEEKYGMTWDAFSASQRSKGDMLLEAKQYEKAVNGNMQMLIWLGKVRLGQKEPEASPTIAPQQDNIDKDHLIMQLQHNLSELESKIANESETE